MVNLRYRVRRSRIALSSIAIVNQFDQEEKPFKKISDSKQKFSYLQFLWQQKYISLEDYLTACRYVELYSMICKISGYPKGFHYKALWHNLIETSRLSWLQSELSMLDQNHFSICSDDELLRLWKILQRVLNQSPIGFKIKFNELLFKENISKFHDNERLYLKAFQKIIPAVKTLMIAFGKQKSPH